ncbi:MULTISPECIES: hypothetical protein [unclassified Breznakia]|uniref:hypothetical protein n=1 Tax=unclassified Breznakia TaxID=2623764 RepID=UPI0024739EA9|nr:MULTISPECIES: hypothetical protein [unclassified Breznakia]MDH6367189.1 hypothetical protein [Breznakia sp. PH1-1]MDH6404391.1 hypothetical protein [Breznakia sp. PF1-11]MDH6412100.1 hypothetical protein [Breznakia sp. PFB1-11]MDH6414379.1 hypothetical protein [Breznakia sp. PFB1-14]MDH6416691.1 hypothetical protein [Breznakia sp. PFB1-4]
MELVLPKHYVAVDNKLEHFAQGYWTHTGHAQWTYTMTKTDCKNISWWLSVGSTVSSAIAYFCAAAAPYASAISTVLGGAAKVFKSGANGNGIRVYFHTMAWGRTPRWASYL